GHAAPTAIARTPDGREVRGVVAFQDTFVIRIIDVSGQSYVLEKLNAQIQTENPPQMKRTELSPMEVRDVFAFLKTLNNRNIAEAITAPIEGGLTFERLRNAQAEPQNWLSYWGDYTGMHRSALNQINTRNVVQLHAVWTRQLQGGSELE